LLLLYFLDNLFAKIHPDILLEKDHSVDPPYMLRPVDSQTPPKILLDAYHRLDLFIKLANLLLLFERDLLPY
jgi:hypothetical protein